MPENHLFLKTGQLGTFLEFFEDNSLNTSSRLLGKLVETFLEHFYIASKSLRLGFELGSGGSPLYWEHLRNVLVTV
jgi:hypothetical protein